MTAGADRTATRRGGLSLALRRWRFAKARKWLVPVNGQSQPNLNPLRDAIHNIDPLTWNVKQLGYQLARQLADALPPLERTEHAVIGLTCRLSTQADIESAWVAHWCAELGIARVYHRKVWELAYVLQGIYEGGCLREGARGLGFGCGTEPIASYLAGQGVEVLATDLAPSDAHAGGWAASRQHADHLDRAFHPHLVNRAAFDARVRLRHVDMNAIPSDLSGYDFCWSVCAFEHLGSIKRGLAFVEGAMATLKPGGVAVHTTEYNIREDGPTPDNWPTVLFQRRHMEALAARLRAAGHWVAPFDLALGDRPMDRFVDVPPYQHDLPVAFGAWLGEPRHLKVSIDGFPATCLGLMVRKGEG